MTLIFLSGVVLGCLVGALTNSILRDRRERGGAWR